MGSVLIVGGGQIGSRHLQALSKSDIPLTIDVYDISSESLQQCRMRWAEVEPSSSQANFSSNLPNGQQYDVAIVATTSLVRAAAIKDILSTNAIRYLVLEKFLFPCIADYEEISRLLQDISLPTWVNCARRMFPFYRELSPKFHGPISLNALGGEWGLGCNGIHMVDLAAWISGQTDYNWDINYLDKIVLQGKRSGTIEFTGTIVGHTATGSSIMLTAIPNCHQYSGLLEIACQTVRVLIEEASGQGTLYQASNNWQPEAFTFNVPFQSELSHILVHDLLTKGDCYLPRFEESSVLHVNLLKAFIKHCCNAGLDNVLCPIS